MRYEVTCSNKECEHAGKYWEIECKISEKDEVISDSKCDKCGSPVKSVIRSAPMVLSSRPYNAKEQGIARDLKEAWKIDKELTYGSMRNASADDKARAKKEIDKLEHS